jgi:hypothetical protein
MKPLVIELRHTFDAFHKAGKILELRPLIVDSLQRAIDNDGFFYSFHVGPPSCCLIVSSEIGRGLRLLLHSSFYCIRGILSFFAATFDVLAHTMNRVASHRSRERTGQIQYPKNSF